MQRVGVVVVGLGHWGPNVVSAFLKNPAVRMCGAVEPSTARIEFVRKKFPELRIESSLERYLDDPDVDAVAIASSPSTHFELAKLALSHGKHALVEKPLTNDSASSEILVQLAKQHQRILMVGHIFLFHHAIQQMKAMIAAGTLGELLYLRSVRTNMGPIRHDVGALWDLAAHDVSISNYLFGALPINVSCHTLTPLAGRLDDIAYGSMDYPGRVVSNFYVSWLDPKKRREITLVGDRCMATFDDLDPVSPLRLHDTSVKWEQLSLGEEYKKETDVGIAAERFRDAIRHGETSSLSTVPCEPLKSECDHFIDCILRHNSPRSDGNSGARVVRILEALELSARLGGTTQTIEWGEERDD